jgi:predicted regulator of Ras-like GTPase activity (Roadblock/LC7/MglB family)
MADLDEILNSFTRVRGVSAALIVGQDGLVLQTVTAPGADDVNPDVLDVLGAMASSGLVPAQEIGSETGRGKLRQGIYEYENGVVVVEPVGESAILVVVTSATANLGLLRLQARKVHADLETALADL